jgi:hypothetical protein
LLVALGNAQRQTGDPAHRETLLAASDLARVSDDTDLLVHAVIANSRGMPSSPVNVDTQRVTALEAASAATKGQVTPERALVLATLATELTFSDRGRMRVAANEAIALARRLEDDRTLVRVTTPLELAVRAPDNLAWRTTLAGDAVAAANRTNDPVLRWYAAVTASNVAIERGDAKAFAEHAEVVVQLAGRIGQPFMLFISALVRSLREGLAGRLDQAEHTAAEALETGEPDAFVLYAMQLITIRIDQGRFGELSDLLGHIPGGSEHSAGVRPMRALCDCWLGRVADAHTLLEQDVADGFSKFSFDMIWTAMMATYAQVAAHLGDRRAATALADLLEPWRNQIATPGLQIWGGSIAHALGLTLSTIERFDEAEAAFAQAANVHERMCAPILLARTRLEWARMLCRRDRDGDQARAVQLAEAAHAVAAELGAGAIERGAGELLEFLDTKTADLPE